MKTFNYEIKDAIGIHARPAGLLAKEAKKYSSKITLKANGKMAQTKNHYKIYSMRTQVCNINLTNSKKSFTKQPSIFKVMSINTYLPTQYHY